MKSSCCLCKLIAAASIVVTRDSVCRCDREGVSDATEGTAQQELRKLRTYLGRVTRDIGLRAPGDRDCDQAFRLIATPIPGDCDQPVDG
jgi:hypothetical protein